MRGQRLINQFFQPIIKKRSASPEVEQKTKVRRENPTSIFTENDEDIQRDFDPAITAKMDSNISGSKKLIDDQTCAIDSDLKKSVPISCEDNEEISQEILDSICMQLPLLQKNIEKSWMQALHSYFKKDSFKKLNDFIMERYETAVVFPPLEKVWNWTQCAVKNTKVVIIGQDPYHNLNQANGLCFSVSAGVPIPPSLANIYKELSCDIKGFNAPPHGDLTGWTKQGVLLLNSVLTVEKNSPNSHKNKGWEELTSEVIKYINDNNHGVIFLLWGQYAQKKASFVDEKKHHVLKAAHPSPYSFHKGFFGCNHFSMTNELLEKLGKTAIDWQNLTAN